MANIRTKKKTNVIKRPLNTNAFDVFENFNVSRNHLKKKPIENSKKKSITNYFTLYLLKVLIIQQVIEN